MRRKSVLVTGASGDIGSEICRKFVAMGWAVIATDKENFGAEAIPCDIFFQMDLEKLCIDCDYRRGIFSHISRIVSEYHLAGLVNNAAVQIIGTIEEIGVDEWNTTLNVNVLAPYLLTRELLIPLESASGSVVNMASIHARLTKPNFFAYAASKAALVSMTKGLSVELGARIRLNAICPAAIKTEMLTSGFHAEPGLLQNLIEYHPSGCLGVPMEVAELVYFLISAESPFMSGGVFELDGGIGSRLHDPL